MTRLSHMALLVTLLAVALPSTAYGQVQGRPGLRFGIGADVSGGIAYGVQGDYTLEQGANSLELALTFFGASVEEDSDVGVHTYHEVTDVLVFGAMVNYLIKHAAIGEGPYFVAGIGAGAFSVDWREESLTDTSLGSALPGGGSFQEEDGSSGGVILNFGIGHRFSEKVDLRAQVPTFFIGGGVERESQVVPTFTITVGIALGSP